MNDSQSQSLVVSPSHGVRMAMEEMLRERLMLHWEHKRTPKNLYDAYTQSLKMQNDATAKIFLSQGNRYKGFRAWVAYHLVTEKAEKRHYKGQKSHNDTIKAFKKLPTENVKEVAEIIGNIEPPKEVDSLLAEIAKKFQIEVAENFEVTHESDSRESICEQSEYQIFRNIPLAKIAQSFPGMAQLTCQDLDGINYRDIYVTMNFPREGIKDCAISLEIHWSLVKGLAMTLFGTTVESVGEIRYIILDTGTKLIPSPEITLKGVKEEHAQNWLGVDAFRAVSSSNVRIKEREAKQSTTDCISMIITGSTKQHGVLTLTLQLEWAVKLSKEFKIYK